MYQAVIFDVDGTLVDSNDAHANAWVEALAESGRRVEFARVRPLIGMGSDKILLRVAGLGAGSPEGRALMARRAEIFERSYLPGLTPTRGARRLLEWLRDERMKLAVASSASSSELYDLLRIIGATKLIDSKISSDGADRSKPDPDVVAAAVAATGFAPAEVVMIGDTPYDVEAATGAGVGIIGLRSGGSDAASLEGALAVYADPEDLLEHYDLSPFKRPLPVRSP
jgi:HAD superfamily hydrolase (TIGR01509 family)